MGSLVLVALAAGCSGGDDTSPTTISAAPTTVAETVEAAAPMSGSTTSVAEPAGEIEWEAYSDNIEVGTLAVPLDYDNPNGEQIELAVARFKALDEGARIGSLLVNPGGPGGAGTPWAINAATHYDSALLDRFDIIGFDPRGVGQSAPAIDCVDDFDPYFTDIDSTPETEIERAELVEKSNEFAAACEANSGGILPYVGTNNAARDMDSIRQALGEETISYFGSSYGSELGAAWVTLFPETVRAAVFDGAVDPNADELEASLDQMAGFEATFESFLEHCDTEGCQFAELGEAEATYTELLERLDVEPLPVSDDRPPVNRDVALSATFQAMYSDQFWGLLDRSLADAINGDGSGLLELHDAYYQRTPDGSTSNLIEAFYMITCADSTERETADELKANIEKLHEVAPLLVPEGSVTTDFCGRVPIPSEDRVAIRNDVDLPPVVVIGTTGDPSTPLSSTEAMADALPDGRLVIVVADQHTGYGVNRCIVDLVNKYLIDLTAPESATRCE